MVYKPRFVVVAGLIGVGKTHFTRRLSTLLDYEPLYEPVEENPYLSDFYKDPKTWAYPMQEFLKSRRFAMYQFAAWGIRCGKFPGVVLDRSIHEDTIFAEINKDLGNIDERNWRSYLMGFQDMQHFLPEPDLYIYLDATPETCCERAAARDRPEERGKGLDSKDGGSSGIPLSYMKTLRDGYMKWLEIIAPRVTVVKLDWSDFKLVEDAWKNIQGDLDTRSRFTRSLIM